jgi:hypothetical protein
MPPDGRNAMAASAANRLNSSWDAMVPPVNP